METYTRLGHAPKVGIELCVRLGLKLNRSLLLYLKLRFEFLIGLNNRLERDNWLG
ncbi:unnamed protein product, partial [Ceratitis capitata]